MNLGLSGRLTRATIKSPLTPLFLLAAIAVGLLALATIPREEEPQISVPMVDIMVAAPGLRAPDAIELVGKPLETIVKSVADVEHVYTFADDDQVMVTARFKVGVDPDAAAVRVHEKIRANMDRIPAGIPEPLIQTRGINDVPSLVLTLSPKPGAAGQWTDQALYELAGKLRTEVAKVDDVGLTFIVGGRPQEIRVEPDPAKLALHGVSLGGLMDAIRQANRAFPAGQVRNNGQSVQVTAGQHPGRPRRYRPDRPALRARRNGLRPRRRHGRRGPARGSGPRLALRPRRTGLDPGPSRQPGHRQAHGRQRCRRLPRRAGPGRGAQGHAAARQPEVAVTRDYGETANEKANELLFHLGLATVSIVVLIGLAIGWREAAVTAVVIPTTILLTLFASNLMGYTINRVSLFALIFSIGILVDDAIVMIENIARHWAMNDDRSRIDAAVEAVAEVGNPTIVATLTVVAALLPMLFVSGLMGPYMAPIPVNASAAMVFSFFVAVVIAPWLMVRFARKTLAADGGHHGEGKLGAVYRSVAAPGHRHSPQRLDLPDRRRRRHAASPARCSIPRR